MTGLYQKPEFKGSKEHLLSTCCIPSTWLKVLHMGYLVISSPFKRGILFHFTMKEMRKLKVWEAKWLIKPIGVWIWLLVCLPPKACLFLLTLLDAPWERSPYGLRLDFKTSREEQSVEKEGRTDRLVLGDQSLCRRWPGKLEMWISSTQMLVLNPLVHFFRKRLPSLAS